MYALVNVNGEVRIIRVNWGDIDHIAAEHLALSLAA